MKLNTFSMIFFTNIALIGCSSSQQNSNSTVLDATQTEDTKQDSLASSDSLTDVGDATLPSLLPAKVCSPDNWCWTHPLPQGNSLNKMWQLSANDIWAVGAHGTIMHWNGTQWSMSVSGTTADLLAIWAASANDIWVTGRQGTVLRWDGTKWNPLLNNNAPNVQLRAVWGFAANDVWALGFIDKPYKTSFLHWNGSEWTESKSSMAALYSLWGNNSNDIWAVGDETWRFNGTQWNRLIGNNYRSVLGTAGNNVRMVGLSGTGAYWNGTELKFVFGITSEDLTRVWVDSSNQFWTTSESGALIKWNGFSWAIVQSPNMSLYSKDIVGSGTEGFWSVGDRGQIARSNGTTWSMLTTNEGKNFSINGIWGIQADDLWAVGGSGVMLRWNGTSWMPMNSNTYQTLKAVFGFASNDVWAVGNEGTILHWNGNSWDSARTGLDNTVNPNLNGIWGGSPNDILAVGERSTILRYNGSHWSAPLTGGIPTFTAIGGVSSTEAWILMNGIDNEKFIYMWNGSIIEPKSIGKHAEWLTGIWGTGKNNIWVAGSKLIHWDGTTAKTVDAGTSQNVSIWGLNAKDMWTTGWNASILHYSQP